MITWNDIDIPKAQEAIQSLYSYELTHLEYVAYKDYLDKFVNDLELLKQKEIKVCRILQKP